MAEDQEELKKAVDWTTYVDLGIKILTGIILTVATFFINTNNELQKRNADLKQKDIENNLKYGDLTKSLMQDLLNRDTNSHLHRDIALIVLNRTIGDDNSKLIANLGYSLVLDYLENNSRTADQKSMQTVISIIQERDTATYQSVVAMWKDYSVEHVPADPMAKTIENLTASNGDTTIVESIPKQELDKLTLLSSYGTVFMQVSGDSEPVIAKANVCIKELKALGFNTPPIDPITAFHFRNKIKYYNAKDADAAKKIQTFMMESNRGEFTLQKLTNAKAPQGLIEVWWNVES